MTKTRFRLLLPVVSLALVPMSLATLASAQTSLIQLPSTIQNRVFTRLLAGNGWETSVVLINLGGTSVSFKQFFLAADGSLNVFTVRPQAATIDLTTSSLQGLLAPNASASFLLPNLGNTVREGWSMLTYDGTQGSIGGYETIRHHAASGDFNFEVTIPINTLQDFSTHVGFDNTNGQLSALTLVNPAANLSTQVRLTYFTAQGQAILLDSVQLTPGAQMTLVLPNTYPDLANKAGMIAIDADINRLSVVALKYNSNSGALTVLPTQTTSTIP